MKRMLLLAFALILIGGMVFAAGSGQVRSTGPSDSIVVGMTSQPVSLDPTTTNDLASIQVNRQIYNTLLELDENITPVPSLAERWVWEDPSRVRLFLRRNVRFHNGDILRASDVKFSLERAAASPTVGFITGMINRVDIINDYEVIILLNYEFVPFLNHLAHPALFIVNERAVREQGDTYGRNPIGTGPMRFDNWVTGANLNLTRFDDHWGGAPRVRNITFQFIADAAARLIALETGEIDINYTVAPSDVAYVNSSPNLNMLRGMNIATEYIGFNFRKTPFNDVRVRQAINYAIDMNAVLNAAYMGTGGVANGPINSMIWASAADRLEPFTFNPVRARQLLAEAGYPNGFSTTLVTNDTVTRVDVAEIVQNMLAQVGIQVEVQILEWGAYLDMTARGDHDMFILAWGTPTRDPDYGLSIFHTSNFGAAGNRMFYDNPRVDALLDQGRQETNQARREQIYIEVQQIIRNDIPWVWTQTGEHLIASRPDLRGFTVDPGGFHLLWNVYFE